MSNINNRVCRTDILEDEYQLGKIEMKIKAKGVSIKELVLSN